DLARLDREQADDGAPLDLVDPGRQHLRLADIARQEQEVVGRQLPGEVEHGGFVRPRHQAELDVAGLGFGVPRVGTGFAHIDLPPSQESSLGHSRLMALAPATRLTWPPFNITSSLSAEPTLAIRCRT